jgi:DNA-binding transcriptional LysR family regulator
MELRHLRYFVRVASELHFGRAAEQLGISQPPLSQQIRILENELGVQLFERSSRKVRLTVAGRLFLDEAKATLERADHAINVTRRAALGELGELNVGVTASALFSPFVGRAIAEFQRTYLDVHLDISELSVQAQREAVADSRLDVGLMRSGRTPVMPAGMQTTRLGSDGMVVAIPANHRLAASSAPLSVAELADEPMLHYPYDREGFLEDLHRLFDGAGLRPRLIMETREISTMLALVSAGVGITVVSESLERLRMDNVRYRLLSDENAVSHVWMIYKDTHQRPTGVAFRELVRRQIESVATNIAA